MTKRLFGTLEKRKKVDQQSRTENYWKVLKIIGQ